VYDCSSEHPIVVTISLTRASCILDFVLTAASKKTLVKIFKEGPPPLGNVALNKSKSCSN